MSIEYSIQLCKTSFGLGIYFRPDEMNENIVLVDPHLPFYRFPRNTMGPGEATGIIKPGHQLLGINTKSVIEMQFSEIIAYLRLLPNGTLTLRFQIIQESCKEPEPSPMEISKKKNIINLAEKTTNKEEDNKGNIRRESLSRQLLMQQIQDLKKIVKNCQREKGDLQLQISQMQATHARMVRLIPQLTIAL